MLPRIIKRSAGTTGALGAACFQFRRATDEDQSLEHFKLNLVTDAEDGDTLSEGDSLGEDSGHLGEPFDIQSLVERAREESEQIVAQARARADQLERDAYAKGLQEGKKSGELIAVQRIEPVLKRLEESIAGLSKARESLLDAMQLEFMDLVVATAEKVVREELTINPKAMVPMLRKATQDLKQKQEMTIFLNPSDYPHIARAENGAPPSWLGSSVRLEEDRNLSRGSLRIHTGSGELDASLETQFDYLRSELRGAVQGDV